MTESELKECEKELIEILSDCNQPNWGGENEEPITIQTVYEAWKFLKVAPYDIPKPSLAESVRGCIGIEWAKTLERCGYDLVSVRIYSDKMITYVSPKSLVYDGDIRNFYGELKFDGVTFPEFLHRRIKQIMEGEYE